MRVLLFLLFPIFLSAQINRAYGVIEIGSFPTSSSTGPKFAYRPVDSSFYRWVSGNTWVKIIEPSIIPDTLYLTEEIGTSYKVSGDTLHLTPYLLKSDTTAMLVRYIERGDTAAMLANYPTFGDVATSLGNYLPIIGGTLTGTGGAGFIGFPSQVSAPGTPASGLNVYAQGSSFNWKGTDGHERQFASTLTGGRTYTLPDVSGTFALGTGTANRVPLWTATNTLGSSNIQDNNTAVSILNSKPFLLGQWTTAGRPTGTTGYNGYNTTLSDQEYYNISDWYYVTPWKQSTSSSNVFLNSGSAIVNTSSVINSNYKLQVNGGALYSGATFTSNQTNQAALDIRSANITAQSGTTHGIWGINIEGAMTFNTFNQTYGGLRIATTSNATFQQNVKPLEIIFSSSVFGRASIINSNASNGADMVIGGGGASAPEKIVMRSPNGGFSGGSSPGYNYSSDAGAYSWVITGIGYGMAVLSSATSTSPNGLNPTLYIEGKRATIGQVFQSTPAATLEIVGEGSTNSTSTLLVQNSTRTNNSFRILNDGTSIFGGSSSGSGAILTVTSTTQGILPPRWTAAQRTAISSPATGLFGYQTDGTEGVYFKQASAWKRLLWEGDAVNTWLKPSLEAGTVIINQGRTNKLKFTQDSAFFAIKNGVIYLQHPTKIRPFFLGSQIIITDDTSALWDAGGSVVAIGSVLGSGKGPGNAYTMVGSETRGISNGYSGFASSAFGYDIKIDSTIKVNAIGHKITANRVSDSDAYGGYITFSKDVNSSGAYGSQITVNRNQSFVFGRGISTRHTNEFLYGSSFDPKHTFLGTKLMVGSDSTFSFNTSTDVLQLSQYGTGIKEASDLSKTQSNYIAGFATDGTVLDLERKRDTTIYIDDSDYDFSAAVTTAQIARRYNRVIFWMTTTGAAGSDSEITLHTPDVNLMQVEYLIHSVDEAGGFSNVIRFGTNNAVDSTNGLVSSYFPAAGDGVHIRAGLRSSVYKYRYSN